MKKNVLFAAFLTFCSTWLSATIHTVSNLPSSVAQFTTIQAAVDAASAGDSIYVHGSGISYASFTLSNKQLIIIGPGWLPEKHAPLTAIVAGANINGTGSSGSEIHGIEFINTLSFSGGTTITDIRVIRCHFTNFAGITFSTGGAIGYSGFLIEGNWFANGNLVGNTGNSYSNFIIQNNIFYNSGCCVSGSLSTFFNTSNFVVDHNLFYGPSATANPVMAGNCRFIIFSNNIFVKRTASTSGTFNTFINNITYLTAQDAPWTVNSNIDGGGNIAGMDPQMTNQANVDAGSNNPLLDFTISGGPADNSGSDGKDMGLLFDATGSLNWNTSRTSRLPLMFSMTITTPAVTPGSNISVTIESRSNN